MKWWLKLIVMRTGSLYWKQGVGEYKNQNNNNNNNKNRKRDRGGGGAEMEGGLMGGQSGWGRVASEWVCFCMSAYVVLCL